MELILTPTGFFILSAGLMAAVPALTKPVYGFILMVVAAVAIDYASHDLVLMGASNAAIVAMLALNVLREKRFVPPGVQLRTRTPADKYFLWLLALALIYMVIGFARGNDPVYVLGDFFHLALEMSVPFFLFVIFMRRRDRMEGFIHQLAMWMLIFSAVVLLLYVTGIFQMLPGAGYSYRGMGILRIRYNHHFPLLPILWLLGVWLFQAPSKQRNWTGLALVAMTIILILGLKRSLWVTLAFVLLFYLTSIGARQRMRALGTAFASVAVVTIVASFLLPRELLDEARELDTYTEVVRNRFSKRESDLMMSIENRHVQLQDAVETALRNPLGYGIGSEFDLVFSARDNVPVPTHHVHNSYLQYVLQIGIWWLFIIIGLTVHVFTFGRRLFQRLPDGELKGAVLGAMGCYLAIIITSLTEISVNTFFLPYSVAAIHVIAEIARREGLIETDAARRAMALEADGV
jgi:hypothetical protein